MMIRGDKKSCYAEKARISKKGPHFEDQSQMEAQTGETE